MWDGLLISARFLQFAGALLLLGSALFYRYGYDAPAEPAQTPDGRRNLRRILMVSALAALIGSVIWLVGETVLIAGDTANGVDLAALWLVSSGTRFGRACLWRIGALMMSLAVTACVASPRTLRMLQVTLAGFATATFAWTGHGATTAGWPGMLHLGSDILHLWMAGAWFGALVPIAFLIRRAARSRSTADAMAAHHGLNRFSAIGTFVVMALVMSGVVNSWFLIGPGHWRSLFSTAYGNALLIKLALFAVMLALAAANRFWLTPRLRAGLNANRVSPALRALKASVLVETGIAVLVLLAVAVLGTLAPPGSGE